MTKIIPNFPFETLDELVQFLESIGWFDYFTVENRKGYIEEMASSFESLRDYCASSDQSMILYLFPGCFDPECIDTEGDYTEVLMHIEEASFGLVKFKHVQEKWVASNRKAGRENVTLSFELDGKIFSTVFERTADWVAEEFIEFVAEALGNCAPPLDQIYEVTGGNNQPYVLNTAWSIAVLRGYLPEKGGALRLPCPKCDTCPIISLDQPNLPGSLDQYINGKFYKSNRCIQWASRHDVIYAMSRTIGWLEFLRFGLSFSICSDNPDDPLDPIAEVDESSGSRLADCVQGDHFSSADLAVADREGRFGLDLLPRFCRLIPDQLDWLILEWYIEDVLISAQYYPDAALLRAGWEVIGRIDFTELKAAMEDKHIPYQVQCLGGQSRASIHAILQQYAAHRRFPALLAALLYLHDKHETLKQTSAEYVCEPSEKMRALQEQIEMEWEFVDDLDEDDPLKFEEMEIGMDVPCTDLDEPETPCLPQDQDPSFDVEDVLPAEPGDIEDPFWS